MLESVTMAMAKLKKSMERALPLDLVYAKTRNRKTQKMPVKNITAEWRTETHS